MANDAVRRIMAEVKEFASLNKHTTSFFHAAPLETDLFEWHFTVRGPPDTAFENGVYHGRILLPPEYPLKAPEIILLTPNGRFEVGKRICLSVTSHHQETWQPSWGIRTILTALVGFMPSKAEGLGALDYPEQDRRGLARKSHLFRCTRCGARPVEQLPPRESSSTPASLPVAASGMCSVPAVESPNTDTLPTDRPIIPENHQPAVATSNLSIVLPQSDLQAENKQEAPETPLQEEHPRESASSTASIPADNPEQRPVEPVTAPPVENVSDDDDVITPREAAPVDHLPAEHDVQSPLTDGVRAVDPAWQQDVVPEKELLYVAYAILVLMLAIVGRRVLKTLTE